MLVSVIFTPSSLVNKSMYDNMSCVGVPGRSMGIERIPREILSNGPDKYRTFSGSSTLRNILHASQKVRFLVSSQGFRLEEVRKQLSHLEAFCFRYLVRREDFVHRRWPPRLHKFVLIREQEFVTCTPTKHCSVF
ncbi:hypothetical protein HanRHA438_Chr05g0212441 [Helianthus annuus]|nr:hypothetical protein HanRHA438_Chr05g0212441 [Helianthus annuus]